MAPGSLARRLANPLHPLLPLLLGTLVALSWDGQSMAEAPGPSPSGAAGSPAGAASPPAFENGEEGFTFVSYNLKNYLAMQRRVDGEVRPSAPKPEEEVSELLKALEEIGPDILGVCEIGEQAFVEDLQRRLSEAGISLPHAALLPAASGQNRNLAVLSRFPIVADQSRGDYVYDLAGNRLPFQRGVLDVTLEVREGYRLRYIGLHLKSRREVPEGDQAMMRLHEARIARTHIDGILASDPEVKLLVAGDFNDTRNEAPVRTLQGRHGSPGYLASLNLADRNGLRWTHYWDHADLYSRIDFVLYSRSLSPEIRRDLSGIHHWEGWQVASDHRPLVVRIAPKTP